jgi:hypothetical protein
MVFLLEISDVVASIDVCCSEDQFVEDHSPPSRSTLDFKHVKNLLLGQLTDDLVKRPEGG